MSAEIFSSQQGFSRMLWGWIPLLLLCGCDTASTPATKPASVEQQAEPAVAVEPSRSEPAAKTEEVLPEKLATEKPKPPDVTWLFNGEDLGKWAVTNFGGEGEVTVSDSAIVMQRGSEITGVHWTGDPLPKIDYEFSLEAKRVEGNDFFCGIVFPIEDDFCSFVVGGWGGGVVGLSAVDGLFANENQTASFHSFEEGRWYKVRLQVSKIFVRAWIDDKPVVDQAREGHRFSVHPAVDLSKPLGLSCYSTVAAVRGMQVRALTEAEKTAAQPADEASK